MELNWAYGLEGVDWDALSELYRVAPLGNKSAADLRRVFGASMYRCFVYRGSRLIGAGRALADGVDCSYLCDMAVHPEYQGAGIGGEILCELVRLSEGHRKIILYANPGTEGFYGKAGFGRMKTAMAIFRDQAGAIRSGLIDDA